MDYKLEHFEDQIEEQENEVENLENEKMECEERLFHIQSALSALEQDSVVIATIEKTEAELIRENEKIEEKLESRKSVIIDLEAAIVNEINLYQEERAAVEELWDAGIDVSKALDIMEERNQFISECAQRLSALAEKLGVSLTEIGEEGGSYGSKQLVKTYGEGSVKKK